MLEGTQNEATWRSRKENETGDPDSRVQDLALPPTYPGNTVFSVFPIGELEDNGVLAVALMRISV